MATGKLLPGVDRDRNLIICQMPDAVVVRLYEVLASWKKNTLEMVNFTRDNILSFLNKNKHHAYILQVLAELREQSLKDHNLIKACPVVEDLSKHIVPVAKTARAYITWKFHVDGNVDIGSTKQPHNRIIRIMAFEGKFFCSFYYLIYYLN